MTEQPVDNRGELEPLSEQDLTAVIGGLAPDDGGCIPFPFPWPDPSPFPPWY
jgi:hypothetical protein